MSRKRLPTSHVNLLTLLSKLQDPAVTTEEVETLIKGDVTLSVKLLKYLNSAHFSLSSKVESVGRAIVYFGLDAIRRWTSLLAMTEVSTGPHQLVRLAFVRARMCELIAEERGIGDPATYFTVGLFSVLDSLLAQSFSELRQSIPVDEQVWMAITDRTGDIGSALSLALACESCEWAELSVAGISPAKLAAIYKESLEEAAQFG